ncbi:hypothetical protein C9374_011450 [Naegleria lovaniensis]|uniref:Cytochrome-b5 reductase n=1 Tax=Naegleria lovaniensis TaxID=51637 RepID=A0AA88KWQ7_NAELO|nr:uncharacterized protein C9374_011450 [Naegleria lovaniensis]KAG2392725.1 hypothetical protein C9374_011450 [Naegleria lovaniensis]
MSSMLPPSSASPSYYSREQVSAHSSENDCWMICHGLVYDVTTYLNEHPGGVNLMMKNAGKDCTSDFEAMFHSPKARNILKKYLIGELLPEKNQLLGSMQRRSHLTNNNNQIKNSLLSPFYSPSTSSSSKPVEVNPYNKQPRVQTFKEPQLAQNITSSSTPKSVMSKSMFMDYKVMLVQNITSDTKVFTMKLPSLSEFLPLKPGQHIQVAFSDKDSENNLLVRKYTPTSVENRGFFELTIKLYNHGKMSQKLSKIKIGDTISARGPFGLDDLSERILNCYQIFMICIGSGITPMYQIIKHVAKEIEEKTPMKLRHMTLLYGNKTMQDIILEQNLTTVSKEVTTQEFTFEIFHKVSREPQDYLNTFSTENVHYEAGRMDEDYLNKHTNDSQADHNSCLFFICGTDEFVQQTKHLLSKNGHPQQNIIAF